MEDCALFRRLAAALLLAAGGAAFASAEQTYSDFGPEPMLAEVFSHIEQNRLDAALGQTERLLKTYPNFRLGHLIKGDLLLARSRQIKTLGNASNAPQDKLADLREEAIAIALRIPTLAGGGSIEVRPVAHAKQF